MSATIFLLSAGFIVYVLFLYPLILAVWARVRPRPPVKRFQPRTVSVLLPVFRGAKWLPGKLQSLAALDYPAHLVEILVLVDGDEDDSADVARAFGDPRVRVIELPRGGKSAALNAGLAAASGEILLMTDVRQELEPGSLERLVACFADEEVGVASGELIIRDGRTREEADVGLYWKYEKFIRSRVGI
ncbi:MAG TPA: glycosyltransferase, partial [Bryobacteraceae bacterium]|nr:glycosyltransferase [Bryobacteraceae bacterium]